MKKIVIFASGSGTNAENVIKYFEQSKIAQVVHVLSNKKDAKVLQRAKVLKVEASHVSKAEILDPKKVLQRLKSIQPDVIVLAGFLLKFPEIILTAFPNQVINIHPALLPKYGGKGMYGRHVHEAVVAAGENETGITIHFVNEEYDEGAIISQHKTSVLKTDTADDVAKKIHKLEYEWLPKVIEEILASPTPSEGGE